MSVKRAVTTNPQKSAEAIVVMPLKLVGYEEGQNLNDTSNNLNYPMKGSKQKTEESQLRRNSTECERQGVAPPLIGIVGEELVEVPLSTDRMLEYILTPYNLNRVYKQVKANKGSGGVDRMGADLWKDSSIL